MFDSTKLDCIKSLFSDNFLWLKVDKAEVLIYVPARFKSGFALFYIKTTFRNLGEKLHGGTVTLFCISKNCFCSVFISWEKSVKSHLDIFVQAFISSHLGCCNSVFTWLSNPALHHLQLLQNAAANISASHLCWSHWTSFPLNRKFNLKFSDHSLHGESHAYISELLLHYAISRNLRCSDPKIQNIFALWPSVWNLSGRLTFSNSDSCSILFCFCLISPVFCCPGVI